jgi:hypothetical protein
MSDLGNFMGALACFVVELIFFGVIVTLFVMGHFQRAWTGSTLASPSNRNTNQLTS